MVGTRRKSKAAAAAHSVDEASSPPSEVPHSFTLSIPEDVDLESLSEIVPDVNFSSLTGDNVISLYRLLLAQAVEGRSLTQELDEARAEIEKKDVELDQALQDKESGSRESETALENVQQELNEVKRERGELAASQSALRAQLNSLQDSQSSTSSEIETLKQRIEGTEREKRDLVGVISRLKQENTQQEEEIQSLRASLKEARQEHQGLETQIRELRSTETATKFKIDSLSQQLELAQAEADRSSAELQNKTEEFSKYRRTKHAELTGIQASYDALTQTHASTQATLKTLQSAHTAQTHQLTQALAKVQDLTGQLAEQEATYASEANGLRRLVTMMEEREKQAKDIVENIEKEWAAIGEKSERREAALKAEIEREKEGRDIAEKRAEQFEGLLDRMGRGELLTPGRATPASPFRTPGTPGDVVDEGMLGLSPTVAIVSKAQKKGKTFTEVYSDYVRLQNELAQKTLEYDNMDRTLSAVLAQIEERAPILSQQRAEYERLQNEASQLASQLSQALSERDTQTGLAQENAQRLVNSSRENELLQKQLEDLGRQVQTLLRELARRDDPTIPSDEDLEGVAAVPAEDTETVITNNLVLFKSISGLQEQNQKLLKIVRELGRKMETEEREYKEAMEREQSEAVKEAHEAIQDMASELERQKAHYESLVQAYVKERDTLRTMLDRTQKVTGDASAANGIEFPDVQHNDTMQELAEVQAQFDAYKMEMGMDSVRLRESLLAAQREAGQLSATLAKANAKIDYLTDRHRMNQEQLAMHNKEIDELSKRNQQLFDQWTRIDIECSRVTEDLQIANGRIEQLRNECANLRAEKKIWEGIESRLVEENRSLTLERSHLSDLMANVQKMHNDLERSGENDRRRLENQLQLLEGQTQDLRLQITQERDNLRHVTLQKEIEGKELQTRLDKSMQDLSKTREALVGAETSKKHFEERIEDLTKQLRGNEEKLAVYERRPSTSAGISQPVSQDMPREQQLEAEVAELRSQLKVTQVELTAAKGHVEQFQEIARANEEALANITTTYDEYRASTEAQITRHEAEYKALQEKLKSVEDEMAQFASRYSELQKTLETERAAWLSDKKGLEDTIVDITTSEKHSESDRALHENEIRKLEERAKAADERYSSEVIAHAESIKAIDSLKRDLASAQTAARDNLTAAETAKASLTASEGSWNQQKEALDKEVSDLNARCQDLASQNSILHQHLESVSSQATRIQQAAESSSIQVGEGESRGDADTKLQELRSVVAYLRKEKEIVDLQLELSKQENARLKTQIEHLSRTLDETRATLSEERERAVENAASAAQHAELLERINQLNILRESNATLRSESENHAKRARELENKLGHLSQELDPAKEQARVAQAELEATKVQIGRLEEESRRWQERNSQLLSKYNRIDPAELQALKDELGQLQTEKTELEQVKAELEKNIASQQETIVAHETRVASLEKSFKDVKEALQKNNSVYRTRMAEFNAQKSAFNDEKRQFESKVASLEQANATLQSNLDKAIASTPGATAASPEKLSEQASAIAALTEERDKLLAERSSWTARTADGSAIPIEKAKQEWEGEKADLIKVRDEAVAKLKTAVEDAQKAAEEALNLKRQNEKFQAKLTSILKAKAAEQERKASGAETVTEAPKADQMVAAAKKEFQKQHAEELKSLEQRLTAKYEAELHSAVEVAKKEAASSAPAPPLYEADNKAAIEAAIAEHEKTSQARHAEEIASAVERGRLEQVAKAKLKDAQLVKSQKKVKELEAQILEWKNAGLIPESSTTPLTTAGGPAAAAAGTGPTTQHQPTEQPPSSATPSTPITPTARTTAANTSLPQRPSLSLTTGPGARGAGRGAGLSRGRILQRVVGGRGGAHRPAPGSGAQAAGVSIMGAAGKRPREDAATTDDSLVKRLKPADATEATSSKPPVTLRRPPASGTS